MEINCLELEDFEPILARLLETAFTHGIRALNSAGMNLERVSGDKAAFRRFVRGCHYGYDLAQREIANRVIRTEAQIVAAEEELRELRRTNQRDHVRDMVKLVRVLRDRELILRRIVDSVLYTMVGRESWVLRRMILSDRIRRIDPRVLEHTARIAAERNRADRMKFNVVADLTTVVQIGDLVEIDWTIPGEKKWRLVELKEGKINEILSGLIESKDGVLSIEDIELIRKTLGRHAPKQAMRMMTQQGRLREFRKLLDTGSGKDISSDKPIIMSRGTVALEDYGEAVHFVYRNACKEGISHAVVDGCLRLVGMSREKLQGTGPIALRHVFYHLANPEQACKLGDPERKKEELQLLSSVPPFTDLVKHNFMSQWGEPILLQQDRGLVLDLVMGRIRIFVQFDFGAFFQVAEADGVKMTWITGKDAEEIKQDSSRIPGSPDAWGVRVQLPNGDVRELLSGFFARAISDFVSPRELLRLLKLSSEQWAS